jgi:signal transduction histidine kinase
MMIDITHRLEQSLKRSFSNKQTNYQIELQRLAGFGRLSANLIHDMSTPLTAAVLTLDEIKIEQSSDPLVKRACQDLKLLEKYVSAARKQLKGESDKVNFSLTVAIRQVIMLLSGRDKNYDVELLVYIASSVRLYGDQVKFHQVMANLINNAIESYVGTNDDRARTVTIRVSRPYANTVRIVIADKGKGIDMKDKNKIFEPFYSTKHGKDKSLGIGLAAVKDYVEKDFNGRVMFDSNIGLGTSFSVQLPLDR